MPPATAQTVWRAMRAESPLCTMRPSGLDAHAVRAGLIGECILSGHKSERQNQRLAKEALAENRTRINCLEGSYLNH